MPDDNDANAQYVEELIETLREAIDAKDLIAVEGISQQIFELDNEIVDSY